MNQEYGAVLTLFCYYGVITVSAETPLVWIKNPSLLMHLFYQTTVEAPALVFNFCLKMKQDF